jgi:hypothetical protein
MFKILLSALRKSVTFVRRLGLGFLTFRAADYVTAFGKSDKPEAKYSICNSIAELSN